MKNLEIKNPGTNPGFLFLVIQLGLEPRTLPQSGMLYQLTVNNFQDERF